ncbi:MAG: hypothetical protein ABII97_00615 [Patescibacteria group bacterium]
MAKIYMICSVRKATEKEKDEIIAYAENMRRKNHDVRCPITDTNQVDELGLRIVEEHEDDIIWADEIHIIWNHGSEGSLWDVAQTRMARRFMPEKKIIVVNVSEVQITDVKSYTNVLLATHAGLGSKDGIRELKKRLRRT